MALTARNKLNLNVPLESIIVAPAENAQMQATFEFDGRAENGAPIMYITSSGKALVASAGCAAGTDIDIVKESYKSVDFKVMDLKIPICPETFVNTQIGKKIKADANVNDEEIGAAIGVLAENQIISDILRLAYLGDTTIVGTTSLNVEGDAKYYNSKDGFRKQAIAAVTAGTMKKQTLVLDTAANITKMIQGARQKLHFSARAKAKLFVTTGIYNALENLTIGQANAEAQIRLIDGVAKLYFLGYEVVNLDTVSDAIYTDFKPAQQFEFGLLTPINNLKVLADREDFGFDTWMADANTGKWIGRAKPQIDFKIAYDAACVYIAL